MSSRKKPGQDSVNRAVERRPLKAVIFDMDGVIIDSHPAHRNAWRKFLNELGKDVSEADLDFILDGRKRADILRYFLGDLSASELEEHGKHKDEFFKQVSIAVNPIPGVLALLKKLEARKVPVAVATSATESRAHSTLSQLRLSERLRVVVTGSDVKEGKPDPAIYQLTCSRLNVDPNDALAFEDAVSGVQAASKAGLRCIGVSNDTYAEKLRQAGAKMVIPDFVDTSVEQLEMLLNTNGTS